MKNHYKNFKKLVVMIFLCVWGLSFSGALGKPMYSPTKEEALKSQYIVIVEYIGYEKQALKEIDYFNGPVARYKVIRILRGENLPEILNVRYDFHDGSACLPQEGWKFTDDTMPQVASQWLLFLNQQGGTSSFATYRGDYGRWQATKENIKEIEEAL